MLHLLQPPVRVALHDHNYTSDSASANDNIPVAVDEISGLTSSPPQQIVLPVNYDDTCPNTPLAEKAKLNVSNEERKRIKEQTRCQSRSPLWHVVRARRITGSKCGKILRQIERTDALLIDVLYPKKMDQNKLPLPIKWGIENESKAREAYTLHRRRNGHPDLVTSPCGFIIHPTMGWLGASPD